MNLVGKRWEQKVNDPAEVAAAKAILGQLEGLAFAIEQTSALIADPNIGGAAIVETYEKSKERIRDLPERYSIPLSPSERAIDAL